MKVYIVKISYGFDRWEWACDAHIAELRARGADVVVIKRPEAWPASNVEGLTCDRCPKAVEA